MTRSLSCALAIACGMVSGSAVQAQVSAPDQGSQTAPAPPPSAQQVLDFIASFPLPAAPVTAEGPYMPPGRFSAWSATDQQNAPDRLALACVRIWTLAHGQVGAPFLPARQNRRDEGNLGVDVCVAGHMPSDWPGRGRVVADAKGILDRARAAGGELRLPEPLTH